MLNLFEKNKGDRLVQDEENVNQIRSFQDELRLFSYEYRENKQVGHVSPAPVLGTPALIWHTGVWMQRIWDPSNAIITLKDMQDALNPNTPNRIFENIFNDFKSNRRILYAPAGAEGTIQRRHLQYTETEDGEFEKEWLEQDFEVKDDTLNSLMYKLQKKGRLAKPEEEPDQVLFKEHRILKKLATRNDSREIIYDIIDKNTLRFTLWWLDEGQENFLPHENPPPEAIRVRVHLQILPDFYTVSFFIDAAKPWSTPRYTEFGDHMVGQRRRKIYEYAELVKQMGQERLENGNFNAPLIPEGSDITEEQAKKLFEARNYLYSGIWHELREDFEFQLQDIVTPRGRCFINMRGVALDTEGVKQPEAENYGEYIKPIKRFREDGDISEPDAVLKSYWPFIRRITPYADLKDHVACGLMNWKAMLITASGAMQNPRDNEEWDSETRPDIPHRNLPEDYDYSDIAEGLDEHSEQEARERKQPIRYLILSKSPADIKQMGRIVDRINVLETYRLFALKDWSVLKNSDTHIRLRGQELDAVMGWWSSEIAAIHDRHSEDLKRREKIRKRLHELKKEEGFIKRLRNSFRIHKLQKLLDIELDDANERRDESLTKINQLAENYLIKISASIDSIGKNIVGGMQYRVNRSSFFINRFNILVDMLVIGKVDTWIGYDQFVDRGLKPEFEFIQQISGRLTGLRNRLESITQNIQTSAIVVQASATRNNTKVLKRIAIWFRYSVYGATGIAMGALAWFTDAFSFAQNIVEKIPGFGLF